MSALIQKDKEITYTCGEPGKNGKNTRKIFKATIKRVGKIFPYEVDGRITDLNLIVGTKSKAGVTRGLASDSPGDLFQAKTPNEHLILLFAIATPTGDVEFFKNSSYELKLCSILHDGEQPRVAEKGREFDNKVPGTQNEILFSEDLVQKAMANSNVNGEKPKKKGGRPPKKTQQTVAKNEEEDLFFTEDNTPPPPKVTKKKALKTSKEKPKEESPKDEKPKARGRPRGRPTKRTADDKPAEKGKKIKFSDIMKEYQLLGEKLTRFQRGCDEVVGQRTEEVILDSNKVEF